MFAQSNDSGSEAGLVEDVGAEIKVAIDRWSAGQIGLPDVLVALSIIAVAVIGSWILRRILRRVTRHWDGPAERAVLVVGQLLSVCVYLVAAALVLEILGFSIGPIVIIVLVVVLAVLFLRPLIQNLSSGLLLQLRGPFELGDVVESNGMLGTVQEVNTRTVVVVTADGRTAHLPNNDVLTEPLVNYSSIGRRRSSIVLHVPDTADLGVLTAPMSVAASALSGVLEDPPAEVVVVELDGNRVCLEVLFWHAPDLRSERLARDGVGRAMLDVIDAAGLRLVDQGVVVRRAPESD